MTLPWARWRCTSGTFCGGCARVERQREGERGREEEHLRQSSIDGFSSTDGFSWFSAFCSRGAWPTALPSYTAASTCVEMRLDRKKGSSAFVSRMQTPQRGRERGRRMSLFLFCCCRPSTSAEASAAAAALFLPRSSLRYHLSHPLPQPQNSKPKTPAASRAASPARPARATLATSSSPFRCTTPWSSGEGRLTSSSSSSSSSSALFFPPRRVSSSTLALSAHFSLLSFSSSLSMRTAGLFTSSSSPPASTASGSA